MSLKRIFLAIPLSTEIIRQLIELNTSMILTNARWTKGKQLHLTLSFLGNIDEKNIQLIIAHGASLFSTIKAFSIPFKGITLAPPHKPPSMLWAEFYATERYKQLVEETEKYLSSFKEQSNNEYKGIIPHATLARFKPCNDVKNMLLPQLTLPDLEIYSIVLTESQLYPEGPQYFPITTFYLLNEVVRGVNQ